jgi:hypothetical protein
VKLAMVRLAGASAARRMAAEREASIAAERSLPAAGATARRRQRDDSGVAATRAWASAARAGRQVATHVCRRPEHPLQLEQPLAADGPKGPHSQHGLPLLALLL